MQPARQTEGARKSARPGWDSSPAGKAAKKPSRATAIRSTTTPPTGQNPAKSLQRDRPWSAAMSTASTAVARKQSPATKENDALNHADRPVSEAGTEKSEQLEGLERGWVGNGQPPRRTDEEEHPPAAGGFRMLAALHQDEQGARPRLTTVQPVTTTAPPAPKEDAASAAAAAGGGESALKSQAGQSALEVRAGGNAANADQEPGQAQKDDKAAGKRAGGCCCSVM